MFSDSGQGSPERKMAGSSSGRAAVINVLKVIAASCSCPAHSHAYGNCGLLHPNATVAPRRPQSSFHEKEYAFEMASSSIRYGGGVTKEVGMDVVNLGIKNLIVITDKHLAALPPVEAVVESLESAGVTYTMFDNVSIEPTDESLAEAISFVQKHDFDGFVAVGGGSVMDTAKAANLYLCHPENNFLDFVNAPIGKGLPVQNNLRPLICVPTTAGTGSETTGVAVFDYKPLGAKTGIGSRTMRPLLGIVDPHHMKHMPKNVASYSGFDVLCHALESYTALPYTERFPRPSNPNLRPAYQGSNPISDIWAIQALHIIRKYFKRAVYDAEDHEARSAMHMASCFAGMGFGNAGCHLPHGMSYSISGLVKSFTTSGYDPKKPLVPHGLSVVVTAPAVFRFTATMCPERHLEAAEILGADVTGVKLEDAGIVLSDTLRKYMSEMEVEDGLQALGYSSDDIPALVKGTLPQDRVTKLSPRKFTEDHLSSIFEDSLKVY